MKKLFFLSLMVLLTSCFYSEMRVDYTVEGCDEKKVFCMADYPYTQEEVGDSVVPYYRYFLISIRNPEKYGLSLSNNVDGKKSDEKYFLVDEYGKKVDLSVTLKIENTAKEISLDSIIIKPDEISDSEFFVKVLTPSISSYEIEFKFEKKDGSVFVFNFKVNQERKKKRYFILGELLRM